MVQNMVEMSPRGSGSAQEMQDSGANHRRSEAIVEGIFGPAVLE